MQSKKLYFLIIFSILLSIFYGCGKNRLGTVGKKYSLDLSFEPSHSPKDELSDYIKKSHSGNGEDIFNLALCYAKIGNFHSADSAFLSAVEADPNDVALLLAVGKYFEEHRRAPNRAIEMYRRATKLITHLQGTAFIRWGNVLLRKSDVNGAAEIFIKGAEVADTLTEEWFQTADNFGDILNRPDIAKEIIAQLHKNFLKNPRISKKLLDFADNENEREKIISDLVEIEPFCDEICDAAKKKFADTDSTELLSAANDAGKGSVNALLAGIASLAKGHKKAALKSLDKFADTPQRKILLARYLMGKNLYESAYRLCAVAYSQAENNEQKLRAQKFAGIALLKCDSIGLGQPMPRLFGGNEPDIFGGALSVLTDKVDVKNFADAIEDAENRFYAQNRGEEILNNLLEKHPKDTLAKSIYSELEKLYARRKNCHQQTIMLQKELEVSTEDEKFYVLRKMLDIYGSDKKRYSEVAEQILREYGCREEIGSILGDIVWRYGRLYGSKDKVISFLSSIENYWEEEPFASRVPLKNIRLLRQMILYRLDKRDRCRYINDRIDSDPYWNKWANYLDDCASSSEILALADKYPFQQKYLHIFLRRSTKYNTLLDYADAVMDSISFRRNSSNFSLLFRAAEAQYWASHFENALPLYEKLLQMRPDWTYLVERTGELARSMNDATTAVKCFSYLIIIHPENDEWLTRLGDICEQSGISADSIWALKIYDNPLEKTAWGDLAAVHWDYLRYGDGERTIKDARKFFNNEKLFAAELGALYDWQKRNDDAFDEYILALETADRWDAEKISDYIERLFKHTKNPKKYRKKFEDRITASLASPTVLDVYARKVLDYGDTSAVLEKLSELAQSGKNEDVLETVVQIARELGKYEIAANAYQRAFAMSKKVQYLISAAEIMEDNKKISRAEGLWKKSAEYDNNYLADYGNFLLRNKKFSSAENVFSKLVESDSLDAHSISNLAKSLLGQNRNKKARKILTNKIEMLKKVAETSGRNYDFEIKLLRAALAETHRGDEPNSALAAYERLLNKYPLDMQILRKIWIFAAEKELAPKLIKYYEGVAQEALKNYRWDMVLYYLNEWEHNGGAARKYLTKACDNEPQMASLWRMRFRASFARGDFADAKYAIDNLKKLNAASEKNLVDFYLATGQIDSAVYILSEPTRRNARSAYSFYDVAQKLFERGLFDYARQYIQQAKNFGRNGNFKSYELLAKLSEIRKEPQMAVNHLSDGLSAADAQEINWRASDFNGKIARLLTRWHYIENAIGNVKSKSSQSRYAQELLKKLYRDGGDVVDYAKMISSTNSQKAVELLARAGEYDALSNLCAVENLNYFSNTKDVDFEEFSHCARAQWEIGNKKRAVRLLKSAPEINPKNPYLYLTVAQTFAAIADFDNAQRFIKLASSMKKYPDARFQKALVKVFIAKGDTASAVAQLAELPKDEKDNPKLWRIKVLLEIGRREQAKKLLNIRIENAIAKVKQKYYYWDNEGEDDFLSANELWDVLAQKYRRLALATDDSWDRNHYEILAAKYFLHIDPNGALEMAKAILRKDSSNAEAIKIYTAALAKIKKPLDAAKFLEKSDISRAMLNEQLAKLYYDGGDTVSGDELLLSAVEQSADEKQLSSALDILLEHGRYELARQIGETAYKLWCGYPEIWLYCGEALYRTGSKKRGLNLIEKAAFQRYDVSASDMALEHWAKIAAGNNTAQKTIGDARARLSESGIAPHRKFALMKLVALVFKELDKKSDAVSAAKNLAKKFPMEQDGYEFYAQILRWAGQENSAQKIDDYIESHFQTSENYGYEWDDER